MKSKLWLYGVLLAVLGLGMTCPASAKVGEDGDFQIWNTESLKGKITENVSAYMEEEFRFGDDASEFYYHHTHLEIPIVVNNWLEVGPAYRQVWEKYTKTDEKEDWYTEYRPNLNVTLKTEWEGWKLSTRNRFEYRMYDIDKDDAFRYRNKFDIKSPWKWTALKINPYISDEIFGQQDAGFNRNRLYVGFGMQLMEKLKGDLFYLWQYTENSKTEEWETIHVIGAKLKVEF